MCSSNGSGAEPAPQCLPWESSLLLVQLAPRTALHLPVLCDSSVVKLLLHVADDTSELRMLFAQSLFKKGCYEQIQCFPVFI